VKRKSAGIIASGIIFLASSLIWLMGSIETLYVKWDYGIFEKFLGLWYLALATFSFVYGIILIDPEQCGRKSGIVVCILGTITSIYLMFVDYGSFLAGMFIPYIVGFILILANYNRFKNNISLKEPEENTQDSPENKEI
jgi:hypothetical protein